MTANAGEAVATEAYALLQAITIAEGLGVGRAIFETDCRILQKAITSTEYDAAPLGALFREIKFRLRLNFIDSCLVHEYRTCNQPAHILAARGAAGSIGYRKVWLESYPNDVIRAVSGDSAVSP